MVKVRGQKNNLCNSILNVYEQRKTAFVKAREKDVAVIELQDDRRLDKRFSCVDGQERPYLREIMQKESARSRYNLDMRRERGVEVKDDAQGMGQEEQ